MYETTESAWVLAELYRLTGNQTYLKSSEEAGQYMLSRQLVGPLWRNTPVYGALPYEWNETHYTNSATTNHAGYTILAWCQLSQITGDMRYIQAAQKYANWLLSFQVTDPDTAWGNHTYANDPMAVGGFYYGYRVAQHEFGWRVAESLWSTSYAIPALLMLSQATGNDTYRHAAQLAANWLTEMKFHDQNQIPLQALAIMKFPVSSWWGRFPQYYQPDMEEVEKAGITTFVDHGRINVSSIKDQHPTWFERTFSVDFNLIDYAMANRGPTYMKMIWSWWPTVGFEPRYGGDIAFGAFGIDGYLRFNATLHNAEQTLSEIDELTGNNTKLLPKNSTAMQDQARTLIATANQNFNLGWYSLALAQADDAVALGRTALTYTQVAPPAAQNNDLLLGVLGVTLSALVVSNAYWYKKLKHTAARGTRKQVRKRRSI